MKVTVAFGEVKVVVPCGNGDITIRQLSELAITRYQKSLQQVEINSDSPRMSVSINALVLARDCGILDWDDSVSDVIDDRELIIARFQNKPNSSNNKTTSNNSTITASGNKKKHFDTGVNAVYTKTNNTNHHLCSEWKHFLPSSIASVSSCVVSQSDEKDFHNSELTGRVISDVDSIENQTLVHSEKNGSCLVSLSPDSIDSSNVPIDHCCGNINSESKCAQNACFWKASLTNKGSFSLEESDSSQWPVPPPLIVTTSDESMLLNKSIFSNAIQTKCLTSTNPNDPLSQSKPLAYNITKKSPLENTTTPVYKMNHDTFPATASLSSSLPSNADAKSLPQSFYSSLESTAVSDNNNSSYDETNGEIAESLKSTSINQLDDKVDESFLGIKSKVNSVEVSENSVVANEIGLNTKCFQNEIDFRNESADCNSSNIPEETNQNRSQKSTSVFYQSGFSSLGSNYSKTSSGLPVTPQMPPPMPPLRSAFTKLSPHPIKALIQPVNFLQINTSDLDLPSDSITCLQLMSKVPVSQPKSSELTKSEHSIPSLFESEDRVLEDADNEWSLSGKSADQESMATTTTTDTSVNTTTTTTTNSHSTLNRTNEKYIITVTLKKSSNGFGFSLTSRQNPVDLTNPVYVSKVLENGPAIFDGRMRPGDRIVMINDEDVSQLSQTNIKDILLNVAAESVVKIGLYRPNSDTISNLIDSINTASTSQKKSSIPQVLNHAGESEDCNQICVEEQKPVSFPMCSCIHKNSQPCSKLNLFHFIIPLRTVKSDFLTPQIFETLTSDSISKTVLRSQNSENKAEPPAIPLNHQNKLSPCSFSNKSQSTSKASNATLGISVRRGVSQMSYNESHIDCQTTCQGQSKIYSFSKTPNQDISESFANNNYVGNTDESVHKFCPNCHGLLSLKSGVFVRSIIPGGAAHMDGRIQTGDEIVAVQGVCLYNGEDFVPPNNKVLLGDVYDSLKFAQVPLKFQNRIPFNNAISSNSDSSDKTDPLNLLKQILSHAQSICSSVSLTILRRSLEQRSCSINTLASVDTNCCHNVTVAADVHMPRKKDDKTDCLLSSFVMPANLPLTGIHGNSVIHKQKIERFEEYHGIDHSQRYYRDECDNNSDHHTSDLICLKSDHGSDDPIPAVSSDNNSLPSPSHSNNVSLADSYHVSSGILTDFENVRVPQVITDIYNDSSVSESSVDNLVTLRHPHLSRQPSQSLSSDSVPKVNKYLGAELDFNYFNRHDSTRQSMSTKRNIYKSPISSNKPAKKFSDNLSSNFIKGDIKYNTMPRPMSAFTLYQVPEEDLSDNLSPETLSKHSFEDSVQTIDRRSTLRRRSGIGKYEERKSYLKVRNSSRFDHFVGNLST